MERIIDLQGTGFIYKGQEIALNETTFLLDGMLDDATVENNPYVFKDLRTVLERVNNLQRTEGKPVTVYAAPYVYWIDDPDAKDEVVCQKGYQVPFGMVVDCDRLKLVGLCENANEVVLAGNRGQSHGARGNYTMFLFRVRELELWNVTLANYCSVDLVYPLMPELNHTKRTTAITQAQLGMQQGDKLFARNCSFVSRLNLMPISGGKRCLYQNCHFESTDDALNGHGVYINCDFDFYGNRPMYCTTESGSVFLNCLFRGRILSESIERKQYFTKEGGPVTVVDCKYERMSPENEEIADLGIAWTKYPHPSLRCYQSNMLYNGKPVIIGGEDAVETVCMEGKEIEKAYRLEIDGEVIYNTYNLLCGQDGWDPLQVKDRVLKAGKEAVPTLLVVSGSGQEMIAGEDTISLEAKAFYFYGEQAENVQISYYVDEKDMEYVYLTDYGDGTCLVEGANEDDCGRDVVVHAVTDQGLEGAIRLLVRPNLMEAPAFTEEPKVLVEAGVARVSYEADFGGYKDCSLITWYRCKDVNGKDAVPVAVTRNDEPMKEYLLTRGDVGYYLMAQVETNHTRSRKGVGVKDVSHRAIEKEDVTSDGYRLETDFRNMPTATQEKILPGFWTLDKYRPTDTADFEKWEDIESKEPWKYGETGNGSIGQGLYQGVQGARLRYTPLEGTYGDMTLRILADPAKTAGQGFGSAGQYMDICVKFDTVAQTGYGVRVLRSKEASDGVRFLFVKYNGGEVVFLNEGIFTSCYQTGLEINLNVTGKTLTAHATSRIVREAGGKTKYAPEVNMSIDIAEMVENPFGGVAIQHTGTPGSGGWQNTTMLHYLEVRWDEKQ